MDSDEAILWPQLLKKSEGKEELGNFKCKGRKNVQNKS